MMMAGDDNLLVVLMESFSRSGVMPIEHLAQMHPLLSKYFEQYVHVASVTKSVAEDITQWSLFLLYKLQT